MRDDRFIEKLDTSVYEHLPISCFVYEPVYENEALCDFRLVYANKVFQREWGVIGKVDVWKGALLRKESLLDEYSLQKMEQFLTAQKQSFVTHLARAGLYLHMEPMTGLPAPYAGFFVTNITEYERREQNNKTVRDMLLSKILVRQFDMVAYLKKGTYGVTIGDPYSITKGSIFPRARYGIYESYLAEQVIPVLHGTSEYCEHMKNALSFDEIERQIQHSDPYVVNITIHIDGEDYHKRFYFYSVDPAEKFYVVLKSDTTELYREQEARNNQMRAALEEAREASIAKTSFLSSMSHEIRTPMNAIIGINNIVLQDQTLTSQTREYLEKLGLSAHHLLDLINDILNMSRIESGRMVLKKEEFSFQSFLDQVNTLASSQCQDKGLQYTCNVSGNPSDYYIGDDMKLKQVLINILGNAIKFTEEGGSVDFIVEQTVRIDNQATFTFRIKDTGIGMDADYIPKIFDAFTQEDATTTNRYGGSGLGMAITKNIVELMNGTITVHSEKGVGSEFIVTVPLKISDRTLKDKPKMSPSDYHVLIVDDDAISEEHTSLILDSIGISCDSALSGEEALKMLNIARVRENPYNLLLVDLKMPGMDGIELTRRIREEDQKIVIVMMTAYSWLDIEEDAREVGVDGFLGKPVTTDEIVHELNNAVNKKLLAEEETHEKVPLAGHRVLMAEDVEINSEIMTVMLEMEGIQVEVAQNGRIAVDKFNSHPSGYYDAILMDMRMPVLDGLEATKEIRALNHPDSKKIPIIALTANAFDEDVQRTILSGMNAFLSKPVEPDMLYATLEKAFSGGYDA